MRNTLLLAAIAAPVLIAVVHLQEQVPETAALAEEVRVARAASDQARRAVESVLASGTLRPEDMARIRQMLAKADPQAVLELRRRIDAAFNRDEPRPGDADTMPRR